MAYSGKFVPKNKNKYKGDHTSIVYRSLWEKHAFKWCDMNKKIVGWSSEEVVVPYIYEIDKRPHRYFVDLKIKWDDGRVWLIEIKPHKETEPPKKPKRKTQRYLNESLTFVKNQNKWSAAQKYAADRKWEFFVWTENELEDLGIMPKSRKPLKKLKPMSKSKKTIKPFPALKKK